jgi:hypothetical protein
MKTEDSLDERVKSYLSNGGLFNPEHMEHDKVRQLIIDSLKPNPFNYISIPSSGISPSPSPSPRACLLADGVPFTLGMKIFECRFGQIKEIDTDASTHTLAFKMGRWLIDDIVGYRSIAVEDCCSTLVNMEKHYIDSELAKAIRIYKRVRVVIDKSFNQWDPEFQSAKAYIDSILSISPTVQSIKSVAMTTAIPNSATEYFCPECQNTGQVTLLTTVNKCRNSLCKHSK